MNTLNYFILWYNINLSCRTETQKASIAQNVSFLPIVPPSSLRTFVKQSNDKFSSVITFFNVELSISYPVQYINFCIVILSQPNT